MLTKFSVSGFKGFKDEFVFNLSNVNSYAFNKDCIKNGVVNNALVYGYNGSGKSNLGLAIFDIISILTDYQDNDSRYSFYLNAYNQKGFASFKYEFLINSKKVVYEYHKEDHKTIISEKFSIDDCVLASFDREKDVEASFNFKGSENLRKTITNKSLSLIKYIKYNSELDKNEDNECFLEFFKFINGMLFYRGLQENIHIGIETGVKDFLTDIIEKDKVFDFEKFLNNAGFNCKLDVVEELNNKVLAVNFEGKLIDFRKIASSGTQSLILFYYWFQKIKDEKKVKFIFIDEFDAFYHHNLSKLVVEELQKTGVQFVLTTHNTSIITNNILRPDCYFLIDNKSICSLSKRTTKELREAHNIEKMYKAGLFNEL